MIDTHCHLTSRQFQSRVPEMLAEARAAGLRGMITVATSAADSQACLELTRQHDYLWCSAGVHPLYADEPVDWDQVKRVAADPRCVAWGELGLDNHYDKPERSLQDKVLGEQLVFIESCHDEGMDKPIIVHCREAFDELLSIFAEAPFDPSRYVFHCFTGTPEEANRVLDFGAHISFTGAVTFKNGREIAEAAKLVPADRIMVETDSPYLTPEPMRKVRPNEPKYVVHIARFLAELRGEDPAAFEQQLDANAERFFDITLAATT